MLRVLQIARPLSDGVFEGLILCYRNEYNCFSEELLDATKKKKEKKENRIAETQMKFQV